MSPARRLAVAALVLATAAPAARGDAQGATLQGVVRADSGRTLVADVAVILPALGRETRTDDRGAFRLDGLPAGRTEVVVRGVGFAPRRDVLTLVPAGTATRDYVLARVPPVLDPVLVRGDERLSPAMRGFEARRAGGFGRFIDEGTLRQHTGRTLGDVVADRIPGVRVLRAGSSQYAVTTRSLSGPDGRAIPRRLEQVGRCYADVYLDGMLVYSGTGGGGLFDLARWGARDFAGVEFYAGGASIPAQYNRTSTGCGVLLLWSRER